MRRRWFWAGLALGLVLLMALAAVAAMTLVPDPGIENPTIATDKRGFAESRRHLTALAREFDDLQTPAGTRFARALVTGCGVDSGDVFQPRALREWGIKPPSKATADAGVLMVHEQLLGEGWAGGRDPDQYGTYRLTTTRDGWSADAVLAAGFDNDSIFVEAHITGLDPCRIVSND